MRFGAHEGLDYGYGGTRDMITSRALILVVSCLVVILGMAVGVQAQTLCAVSYTCAPASSQGINTNIVIAAMPTGGDNVQYLIEVGTGAGPVWTTLQDYSPTKTCAWRPAVPGSYTLRVQARDGANGPATVMASATYIITPAPPTSISLMAAPASPQPVGTTTTLTAVPTGGTAPQYKFEVGAALLQDWSSDATYDWTPGIAGLYTLKVSARETGLPSFVITKTLSYMVSPTLSAAVLGAEPTGPQPISKTITLSGSTTGGANVQYKFEIGAGNPVVWVTKQAYSMAKVYNWSPTTANSYSLRVTAREGTNDATAKTSPVLTYLITPSPPNSVSLDPSPVSPEPVSTHITLTAQATGGTTPQYRFQVGATVIQDWSVDPTCDWTPTAAGVCNLQISARETGLPSVVVSKTLQYTITPVLSAAALTESPAGPQPIGKTITLTGSTTGGANAQYRFDVGSGNPLVWVTKQAYSATKTYSWIPTAPDTYSLRVAAREGADDATAKTSAVSTYVVAPMPPTSVAVTSDLDSPQSVNTTITLTASAIGGTSPEYKFEAGATLLQDWSSDATCDWTPTAPGQYILNVSARETGLTTIVITRTMSYTIAPALSAATLSTNPVAPQSAGKLVVLIGSTTGGANIQYRFDVGSGNPVVWVTKQAYSTTQSYAWTPITPDTYSLRVLAREGTDDATARTSAVTNYLITPTPPSAVTLMVNPLSPQPANAVITLTAAATGGTAPQYKFEAGTSLLQDWSSDSTYDWAPGSPGSYTLKISARETGLPAVVVTRSANYVVTAILSATNLSMGVASPQPVSKMITLTGSTVGGANVQYKFEIGTGNPLVWVTKQAYSSAATYTWTPVAPANYSLKVTAREGTDDASARSSSVAGYSITPLPPASVTLSATPASPQPVDTTISLTAAAVGGTAPQYKFEAGTTLLQDWSSDFAYDWTPTGPGVNTLKVSCRESGLPAYVVTRSISYVVKAALSAASLTVSDVSPQPMGKAITLTGSTTGGANVQYKFDVGTGNPTVWVTKQAYSVASIYIWTPATPDAYSLRVTAREGADDTTARSSATTTYLITPTPPTAVSLTPSPVSPQPANTTITLTTSATGGTAVQYKFEVGGTLLQDWSTDDTYDWTPATAGSYSLRVSARETGLPATVVTRTVPFVVSAPVGLSAVAVSASPDPPQAVDTEITLTAQPTGGSNVQYKFEVGADSGAAVAYSTEQTWGSARTHTWTPPTANNYYVKVSAREGAEGSPVTSTIAYVVPGDMVVTGAFSGFFYVQNTTGANTWGTRVVSAEVVTAGDMIQPIVGSMATADSGEHFINATSLGRSGMAALPRPIDVLAPQTIATAPKTGVLIITHGKVTSTNVDTMVIGDGKGGGTLKVVGPIGHAQVGNTVDVTGICSLDAHGVGLLLTRSADDVVVR